MTVKHLTQTEVARRWCLSPRTLERWRWLGQGPAFLKLGGRVAYRLEDIEAFEAAQTRDATSSPQSPHAGIPAAVTA
ncbi:helix-turn-helix transcriptional regulator [Roseococcus sp. DSY-14]|uniref:helix-turn-helix transcriptional regulator n=1 Tax=Roseococcus sp. DSY-14 TaxID=3369650 RepID=UPI00387B19FC